MKNYNMCCKYCTESLCSDIQNKMSIIKRFNTLVRTLNINEDKNQEKLHGISTKVIRKLTDLFFTIIGEKASSNFPFKTCIPIKECKTDMSIWTH